MQLDQYYKLVVHVMNYNIYHNRYVTFKITTFCQPCGVYIYIIALPYTWVLLYSENDYQYVTVKFVSVLVVIIYTIELKQCFII